MKENFYKEAVRLGATLGRWLSGKASEGEKREAREWTRAHEGWMEGRLTREKLREEMAWRKGVDSGAAWRRWQEERGMRRRGGRGRRMARWTAAASVAALAVAGTWWWTGDGGTRGDGVGEGATVTRMEGEAGKVFLAREGGERMELERDSLRRVEELWRGTAGEEAGTNGEEGTGATGGEGKVGETAAERVAWERLYTTEGAIYSVILADGTKVWLNAESELRYPIRFADSVREVAVRGEAYFEVAKEGGRPFRVVVSEEGARRGRLVVEVTGTEFNVRNYEEDRERAVVLVEGGVRVTEGGQELARLRPQEGFEQEAGSGRWHVGQVNVEREVAWRQDMFVFENESMKEIARELGRWYGTHFEVDPRLAGFRYSGNISRNESLERVLDILRLTKELEFMKGTGNEIKVIPKV